MKSSVPSIAVIGSLNIDWTACVRRLPAAGQTVPASAMARTFGGKGANQAIAAARQGARVSMIGCLGDDEAGASYRARLEAEGIDHSGILTIPRTLTGTALIAVDDAAENTIIVAEGANGRLKPAHLRACRDRLVRADAILLQWETPRPCVLEALKLAASAGIPAVMNPSPLQDGFPWGKHPIHTLIVNETEAAGLFGKRVAASPEKLRGCLVTHGLSTLVVTRGASPTWGITRDGIIDQATLAVKPVDTVGAGDSFAGAYTAALARGLGLRDCLRHANIAGALATTKSGAQSSIPGHAAVRKALGALP